MKVEKLYQRDRLMKGDAGVSRVDGDGQTDAVVLRQSSTEVLTTAKARDELHCRSERSSDALHEERSR